MDSLRYCYYLTHYPKAAEALTAVYLRQFKARVRKYSSYQMKTQRLAKEEDWLRIDCSLSKQNEILDKIQAYVEGDSIQSD